MSLNTKCKQSLLLNQILFVIVLIFMFLICLDITTAEKLVKCDFQKYPNVGCLSADTQECDKQNEICKCSSKYPINLLNGICLEPKSINESCMGSIQCHSIPNAGCFGLDTEFKDDFWILLWFRFGFTDPGKCECDGRKGFEYNNSLKACIRKAVIGSRCSSSLDCNRKMPNSLCGVFDRCQCKTGYYYDSDSDSCKLQLNYDDHCISDEGCVGSALVCVKGQCKCKSGFHFDKYKSSKCEPNENRCRDNYVWNEALAECVDRNVGTIKSSNDISKLSEFDLIEPPRIYSIFVILALWICLLFILGNAKRGLRLVEQAVRRDQASQYRQCDTCTVQSIIETEDQEMATSQMSLQSSVSAAINSHYPPSFEELYPNEPFCAEPYSDEPPTYEEVVRFDKHKTFVV